MVVNVRVIHVRNALLSVTVHLIIIKCAQCSPVGDCAPNNN